MLYDLPCRQRTKHSTGPTPAEKLTSFATTWDFSHWPFIGYRKVVLQKTFSFILIFKENKLKRFLWHGPVLMHCIIKHLFCIDGLLCENKHKERQHDASSAFSLKSALLLCVILSLLWQHKPQFSARNLEQKQGFWIKYSMRLVPVACSWRKVSVSAVIWKHPSLKDVTVGCLFVSHTNYPVVTDS